MNLLKNNLLKNKTAFYAVLLLAMLVQTFPFGFRYFPFADDYFALGTFSLLRSNSWLNIWQDIVVNFQLFGFRPLAGILEAYFFSAFWPNMAIPLLLITVLRLLTLYLFGEIMEKSGIIWGRGAVVFFAFFPTMTESAYWLSASVRIVTSGFLGVLAAYSMLRFLCDEGKYGRNKPWLPIAFVSGLAAQGFYEQGIIFTFLVTMGVLVLHHKRVPFFALFLWPVANLFVIGVHYFIFRDVGWLGPRAEVELNFIRHFPIILERMARTFFLEQVHTIVNTLRWGLAFLFTEHPALIIVVAALSALLAIFVVYNRKTYLETRTYVLTVIAAFVLIMGPMSLFFVLPGSWIWVRNFYFSMIGLAVLVGIFAQFGHAVKGLVVFVAVFLFFSGYIMEVESIRRAGYYDSLIVGRLVDKLENTEVAGDEVWLFGMRWNYAPKINPRIASQLWIDWAADIHYGYVHASRHGFSQHYRFIPVMDGQRVYMGFADSLMLGLDGDLQVRLLHFDGGDLIFSDSGEVFGSVDSEGVLILIPSPAHYIRDEGIFY